MQSNLIEIFKQYGHEELASFLCEERQLALEGTEIVEVNGAVRLYYVQSDTPAIFVLGQDQKTIEMVAVECQQKLLKIGSTQGNVVVSNGMVCRGATQMVFGGSAQQFNGPVGNVFGRDLIVQGSVVASEGRMFMQSAVVLMLPKLPKIKIAGSVQCFASDIQQTKVEIDIAGAGMFRLSGIAEQLNVNVSGAGSVKAKRLTAKAAHLVVSGAGSIRAHVTETVDATISGTGQLKVSGNPHNVNRLVSGPGKFKLK